MSKAISRASFRRSNNARRRILIACRELLLPIQPKVIERSSEIVDSISDNRRDVIRNGFDARNIKRSVLNFGCRVRLGRLPRENSGEATRLDSLSTKQAERYKGGVNPKNETVKQDTLSRKGTASGKETVFGALPAGRSGATERVREDRGTRRGAGRSRRQLYRWRDELDPEEPVVGKPPGQKSRASTLREEVNHLKRVLAEKTLEVDFFRSALQKVEARRHCR
jgi:hypothetical protein